MSCSQLRWLFLPASSSDTFCLRSSCSYQFSVKKALNTYSFTQPRTWRRPSGISSGEAAPTPVPACWETRLSPAGRLRQQDWTHQSPRSGNQRPSGISSGEAAPTPVPACWETRLSPAGRLRQQDWTHQSPTAGDPFGSRLLSGNPPKGAASLQCWLLLQRWLVLAVRLINIKCIFRSNWYQRFLRQNPKFCIRSA
ncbi:hypothetical protein SAMD00079811_70520 [Scytonema sp. HK-05]|nr:hypothetical protein SAMD00079811_70520 [Scytonema sp. HK-05]